jgi:hypothetical protein
MLDQANTSPLPSESGSNQPLPSWMTMMIVAGAAILHRLARALLHIEGKARRAPARRRRAPCPSALPVLLFHSRRALTRSSSIRFPPRTSGQEPKAAKSKAGKGAARNPE